MAAGNGTGNKIMPVDALKILESLIEKNETQALSSHAIWAAAFPAHAIEAYRAWNGSADEALKLLKAVTPDWSVDDWSENGRLAGHPWGCRLERWAGIPQTVRSGWGGMDGKDLEASYSPSQALLVATIRAKIEDLK